MSQTAIDTFSTFGVGILCVVLGIIALSMFFALLSWLSTRGAKPENLAVRGVIRQDTWVTVHMSSGEPFERVRFIGFTSTESFKSLLPYDLTGMVILEAPDGQRTLVRAKAIKMIVITPAEKPGSSDNNR